MSFGWALCADKYTATLSAVHSVIYQQRNKRMQKTVLNDVFELLVKIGAVSSESEFSKD